MTPLLIMCCQEAAERHHLYRPRAAQDTAKSKTSKAKLKRSTGAQGLDVVTRGCCDIKILQVCGYLGGSSLSLLALQALWDLCNKAIVSGK